VRRAIANSVLREHVTRGAAPESLLARSRRRLPDGANLVPAHRILENAIALQLCGVSPAIEVDYVGSPINNWAQMSLSVHIMSPLHVCASGPHPT
jgi:hypothetical protein